MTVPIKNKIATCLLATTALSVPSIAFAADNDGDDAKKWQPTFELESKASSSGRKIVTPKFLIPVAQSDRSLLFADIRSRFDNQQSQEYNLGLGYRRIVGNWIVGGYGFFDYLDSTYNNKFRQGTVGLEALSENFDFRTNFYLPESKKQAAGSAGTGTLIITGNEIGFMGGLERALPGFDGEIGYKLPIADTDIRVYAGGYHFRASGFDNITGPRGRIEMMMNADYLRYMPPGMEITLGAEIQHDQVRDTQVMGLLEIRIPFGYNSKTASRLTPLERRMTKFIERDIDIVSTTAGAGSLEHVLIDGHLIDGYYLIDGTTADVAGTIAGAGSNALIIADGSAGNIDGGTALVMQNGQIMLGGGTVVTVTGATSGVSVGHTFSGSNGTFDGTGNVGNVITAASNNIFENFSISGGNTGIGIANGVSSVTGANLTLSGQGGNAISDSGATTIMSDLTISNSTGDGIYIGGGATHTYSDVAISNAGDEGISIDSANSNASGITFSDLTIATATGDGIGLTENGGNSLSDITLSDVTMTGVSGIQLNIGSGVSTVLGDDLTFTGGTIGVSDNGASVTLTDLTISGTSGDGIYIGAGAGHTYDNISITNAGDEGVSIDSANGNTSNVDISDITIATAAGDGIGLTENGGNSLSDITLSDVTMTGVTGVDLNIGLSVSDVTGSNLSLTGGTTGIRDLGTNVSISGYDIANMSVDGIFIGAGAGHTYAGTGNTILNSGDDGIDILATGTNISDVNFSNLTVNGAGDHGVVMQESGAQVSDLSFTDVNVSRTLGAINQSVFLIGLGVNDVTVTNMVITGGGYGFEDSGDNVTISNVSSHDTGDDGFIIRGGDGHTYTNLTAYNNGDDGLDIDGTTGIVDHVTITGMNIHDVNGDGIDLESDNFAISNVALSNFTISNIPNINGSGGSGIETTDIGGLSINNFTITNTVNAFKFGQTTGLSGTGNTISGSSGSNCVDQGGNTGSVTYNTVQTCP